MTRTMLRGGSWHTLAWRVRVSTRYWFDPSWRYYTYGLRLVLRRIA